MTRGQSFPFIFPFHNSNYFILVGQLLFCLFFLISFWEYRIEFLLFLKPPIFSVYIIFNNCKKLKNRKRVSLVMAQIFTCDLISAANFYSDMSQRILCLIRAVINSQTIQTYKKIMQFYTKG